MRTKNLFLSIITVFATVFIYRNYISDEEYTVPKHISVGKGFATNFINVSDAVKEKTNSITMQCEKNDCKAKAIHDYVKKINYTYQNEINKRPTEVIKYGGDCDEKSQLMASMLKAINVKSVLIYTNDHAFIAVEMENEKNLMKPYAKLEIEGKNYYYAETTDKNAYIGAFNNIDPKDFIAIYDVENEYKIKIEKAKFRLIS
ncbi:MAG: transglutaminase domain-containing protein [Campylobacterota bacterium]